MNSPNRDPLELAFSDFFNGDKQATITIHNDIGDVEEVPVSYFFRSFQEMPLLEQKALELCRGSVLDVGAGSGCHSLILKERGMDVTPLEIRPALVEMMKKQGLENAVQTDFYKYRQQTFDTLLLLMNGIGFAGNLQGVDLLLKHAQKLLKSGGQIILDSSDLMYMYEEEDGSYLIDLNREKYYGEVEYQFEYKGQMGKPFDWIFVDYYTLEQMAAESGFRSEIIYEGEHFEYLARIYNTSY
ncbi:MAG TPA: methyltransferase domain-containing protein [Bacteroidales bacterium]|nr:methyltransferase domain-containing protein [Bacteroidales bacterium]HRX98287.1 methyltransferase domain-containing protein [Bacteroidales bacterium]